MSLNRFQKTSKDTPFLARVDLILNLKAEDEITRPIDEMMPPYKGAHARNMRHYVQQNTRKSDFKLFVRAEISGVVCDIDAYVDEDEERDKSTAKVRPS